MPDEDVGTLHNAIVILMARDGLTADEALACLTQEGTDAHMTPGDFAYDIVVRHELDRGER